MTLVLRPAVITRCFTASQSFVPAARRTYASSSNDVTPVELAFDLTNPSKLTTDGQSLVICHGLFGSKQNWRSLAKMFSNKLGMPVYTLDLRNHGASPHAEPHTYAAMALDISKFFQSQGLSQGVNLLGHSMGGKAVMALALNEDLNSPLRSLISVDMSPAKGRISPEFASYTEGMMEVENARVKTKAEADTILKKYEPMLPTRQFLLTNTKIGADDHLTFRIPLPLLSKSIPSIGDFPFVPPVDVFPTSSPSSTPEGNRRTSSWSGPTLFIKGEHSRYLNKHNIPVAKAFFPNMKLETLDAGHWVHAERPAETVAVIDKFLSEID